MNSRRIRVKTISITQNDNELIIKGSNISLPIPKSYIIKSKEEPYFEKHSKTKQHLWTNIYLDPDFFKHKDVLLKLRLMKNENKVFIYGKKAFGIIWNSVIERLYSRRLDICFFCDENISSGENRTKDHLIPRVILKAYGFRFIDDNVVPCCLECNKEKSSLHPYVFREKVKLLIRNSRNKDKWKKVLKVLNKILIEKKDPFL